MASVRERRRADTIDAVTATALTLFEQQGYDSTTVADVARASGISRRTIFRHFAGKDDLLRGIHERWLNVFADHLELDADDDSSRAAIEPAMRAIVDVVLEAPEPILRVHRLIEEVPALRAAWIRYEREWCDTLAETIDREHGPGAHLARIMAAAMAANLTSSLAAWSRRPDRVLLPELIADGFDVVADRLYRPRTVSDSEQVGLDANGLDDVDS